jgi:hypothetical protein
LPELNQRRSEEEQKAKDEGGRDEVKKKPKGRKKRSGRDEGTSAQMGMW